MKISYRSFLTSRRDRLVLGLSSGVDSVAALHFLTKHHKNITVFHFNHKLRPQNDVMETNARRLAAKLGLEIIVATADEFPLVSSTSQEAAARDARLNALEKYLPEKDIILCHHLGDAMESYLNRCFLGTLCAGSYYTIPPSTTFPRFRLIRPFLQTTKKNFQEYCESHSLMSYVVEDQTNSDIRFRRNFLRHKVIPLLNEKWNGLEKVVLKKVAQDYQFCLNLEQSK